MGFSFLFGPKDKDNIADCLIDGNKEGGNYQEKPFQHHDEFYHHCPRSTLLFKK